MRRGLILSVLLAMPSVAAAHGPAPAALGAVGPPESPVHFVRTNIGIAAQNVGDFNTFHYLCPAWWGETEGIVPHAVATSDGLLTLAHRGQIYLAHACGVIPGEALPGAGSTAALAVDPSNEVWIVTREGADSTLWRTAGGQVVDREHLASAQATDVHARQGEVLVAIARPRPRILRRGAAGPSEEVLDLPELSYLGLRLGGRFLHATTDEGPALYERTDAGLERVLGAFTSIHGPVPLGDGWLAVADGVLHHREAAHGPFIAGAEARWTCLQAREDGAYACFERRLHRIGGPPTAPVLQEVFALEQIIGVDACGPEARGMCSSQWSHFGAEAGLVRADAGVPAVLPRDGGPPGAAPASGGGGCSTGGGAGDAGWGWVLVLGYLRKKCLKSRG